MLTLVSIFYLISRVPETESLVTNATIYPREYITFLNPNANATFQCETTGADSIHWVVDGRFASTPKIRERGITTSQLVTINIAEGRFASSISLPRTSANSNTSIICIANVVDVNAEDVLSVPAYFKVQGLLDPPSNLSLTSTSFSDWSQKEYVRLLTWSEPKTLNITDIEPDIAHYRVCYNITNHRADAGTTACGITYTREFMFLNVRVHISFSVAAVNVVGEGNASTIMHWACDETTGM